jgi:hypothetical protein
MRRWVDSRRAFPVAGSAWGCVAVDSAAREPLSNGKVSAHRSDTGNNGVDPFTGRRQTSWVGQVSANYGGTKLAQSSIVGVRPQQTPHLLAILAKHPDNAAAQLACATDD